MVAHANRNMTENHEPSSHKRKAIDKGVDLNLSIKLFRVVGPSPEGEGAAERRMRGAPRATLGETTTGFLRWHLLLGFVLSVVLFLCSSDA